MPDEPIDEGLEGSPSEGISRRRMLRRIGVATAIAWTAPVVTSLRTPAFADGISPSACPPWNCGDHITECGSGACNEGLGICICDDDVDGKPFCWNDFFCADPAAHPCESNSDCLTGWACTSNCCGTTCVPPCGTCGGGTQLPGKAMAGRTGSGR